jgi:DNA-binding NarL/FixJ family response regulator
MVAQKQRHRVTASLPPELAVRCAPSPDAAKISREQGRLLALLAKGYTIKEASSVLSKSEKTLYVQLGQTALKLGLHSIAQITIYACRWFGQIP